MTHDLVDWPGDVSILLRDDIEMETYTGRLRWGKDGTLQQEVRIVMRPSGAVRVGWRVVETEA